MPAALTPLAETGRVRVLRHVGQMAAGSRPELWWAISADGLWSYERSEIVATPWEVTYRPTGQSQWFGSLEAARRWTATDAAVSLLKLCAQDAVRELSVDGVHCVDSLALQRARVALDVHDAHLLVGYPPLSRCRCGGLLALEGDYWMHVNACSACWSPEGGWSQPCSELEGHRRCGSAEAVQCGHLRCYRVVGAGVGCANAFDDCCGCCHGDE